MTAIFVYGTLLQGQSRGSIILGAGPLRILPARTPGRLVDLGDHPGLLPARSSSQWVFGEFAEFEDARYQQPESRILDRLLPQLDFIEEYLPESEPSSLYLRRSVPVTLEDGTAAWAWAYLYNRPYDPRRMIQSGDWRQREK